MELRGGIEDQRSALPPEKCYQTTGAIRRDVPQIAGGVMDEVRANDFKKERPDEEMSGQLEKCRRLIVRSQFEDRKSVV